MFVSLHTPPTPHKVNVSIISAVTDLNLNRYSFKIYMRILLSNSNLSLVKLGVDFVLPLSQEQQEQEEEPPTKYLSCYRPDFDQTLNVGT